MQQALDFYEQLALNNNKPWFDAHKAEYLKAKATMDDFALRFLSKVEVFDPRVHDLRLGDITYRIYRDIRFSPDKTPYKNWHGVYICPKGKKSGMAGYYIHFEPHRNLYFICAGLYNPTKEVLASVRDEIMCSPEEFHQAIVDCGEVELNWEGALKKIPAGYDESDVHSEYYRLRSYEVYRYVNKEDVLRPDYLDWACEQFRKCVPFNELLNRCYDYAFDKDL